jgi:hypothetical protein
MMKRLGFRKAKIKQNGRAKYGWALDKTIEEMSEQFEMFGG